MKQLREAARLSMDEAAERAGLANRQAWYDFESGRYPDPRVSRFEAAAAALGCSVLDLLTAG